MTAETATAIASGVGPLVAGLIGAYQLWLKPKVDEERELPFDADRLKAVLTAIRRTRFQLLMFMLLVIAVTSIPVGGSVLSILEIDSQAAVSLPKVLVGFLSTVGVVHVAFLAGRFRALGTTIELIEKRIAQHDNQSRS